MNKTNGTWNADGSMRRDDELAFRFEAMLKENDDCPAGTADDNSAKSLFPADAAVSTGDCAGNVSHIHNIADRMAAAAENGQIIQLKIVLSCFKILS